MRALLRLSVCAVLAVESVSLVVACNERAGAPSSRYSLSEGVVVDEQTGLSWQRIVEPVSRKEVPRFETYCSNLLLEGGGWRLPSIKELQTIVDETRTNPAIDPVAFPDTPSTMFDSSTERSGALWGVNFSEGTVSHFELSEKWGDGSRERFRCVRSSQ